jgi:putative heme-binding domain-containing protein
MWVLERLSTLPDDFLRALSDSEYPLVRVHVMRLLAERPSWNDTARLMATKGMWDSDSHVRKCAVDSAGRHPSIRNVLELLRLIRGIDAADTHLMHTARMALRDQYRDDAGFRATPPEASVGDRDLSEIDFRAIADVMPGVHTPESARWLMSYLLKGIEENPENISRYEQAIARYGNDSLAQQLTAYAKRNQPENRTLQLSQLRAIHGGLQERGGALPADTRVWAVELATSLLASKAPAERSHGTELAGEFRLAEVKESLIGLARELAAPEEQRLKAFQSLMAINADEAVAPLGEVLVQSESPMGLREQTANLLGQSGRKAARVLLIEALPKVPTRLHTPIAAAIATDRDGAEALLKALKEGKASPRLVQEPPVAIRLSSANLPGLAEQLAELTSGLPPADAAIQERIQKRLAGFAGANRDLLRGAEVFKKNCAACHQLSNEGAKVGPQLDGVGARGAERLIEDILDPNRNVDQAFRATTLALDDGRVLTGLVLRDPGEVIVLADTQGKEITIEKKHIEERAVVPLSPMPANLGEQVSEADFYDLVSYLLSRRIGG